MKRKIAFILALCMLMTLAMPIVAFAEVAESDVWSVRNVGDTEDTGYSGFGKASAALKDGGTITLLKDFTYTDASISLSQKNITFNGNGKTLTYVNKNSAGNKGSGKDERALLTISSTGTVVINDLKIALGQTAASNSLITALSITGAGADVTLKDCEFTSNRMAVWVTGAKAKLTIDGGTYEATNGATVRFKATNGECVIKGGTFNQSAGNYIVNAETFKNLTINGGDFNRSKDSSMSILYACTTAGGEINITGGNFRYLAAGSSGRYSVLTMTHHKVTVSGGLFELRDTKNKAAFGTTSDAAGEGALAITGGVFVYNGTLCDTNLNSYFASVDVSGAVLYGMSGAMDAVDSGITMDEGAAVRLVSKAPEDSGIRFTSSITAEMVATAKANAKDGKVTYGTILVPTEKLATTDFTVPVLEANGIQYQNIVAKDGLEGSDESGYTLNCALIRIKASHYDMALSARAYVSYVDANGRTVYIYSAYNEALNSRSISYVAEKALADTTQNYSPAQIEILNGYLTKSPAESGTVASEDSNS